MKKLTRLKTYPSNLQLFFEEDGSDEGECENLCFDGCFGEFTREEWAEGEDILDYDEDSRTEILDTLEILQVIQS